MPDLNDLDRFDEGLPVNPLPASEVRRRGDRMRRRNTVLATVGGVAAAAVFIGTPVAVVASQDGDDDAQPVAPSATSQSPPEVAWVQEVPEDFPLTDGFPETNGSDGSPVQVVEADALPALALCQVDAWAAAAPVDAATADYAGESEDSASRSLALFADDAAAEGVLAAARQTVSECPEEDLTDAVMQSRIEELDLGTESSLVIARQVVHEDGSISGLFMTEVARTGNALFVSSSYGSAGGDQVITFEADRLRQQARAALDSMCQFAADPCEDVPTASPSASDEPSPPSEALADFPLDLGYPETNDDGSPVEVTGEPGVGLVELCGEVAWDPYAGTTDVIGVEMSIPEDYRGRTLAIYESEDAADAAVEDAGAVVAACPEEASDDESGGSRIHRMWEDGSLGDNGVVWTTTYRGPDGELYIGRTVYHVVRVGKAVYASFESNEGGTSNEALAEAVQSAIEQARPVVEAMRGL